MIRLIDQLGGIQALLTAKPAQLEALSVKPAARQFLSQPDSGLIEQDLNWLEQPGHHLLTWSDQSYPDLLRDIPNPPAALFVAGDPELLWRAQIAIIGSRNPTAGGRDHARDFARELSSRGFAVTSGLADGIDSEAHQATLQQAGTTIAVAGTGLDQVYPARNRNLANQIADQGVLASEYPPGTPPRRAHFPARNRIISGLSLGVLVIEAGLKSGSLITARLAAEQGREVFALPGSVHNPLAKGCHRLIRDGAKLVETAQEVIDELAPVAQQLANGLQRRLAQLERSDLEDQAAEPQLEFDTDYQNLWDQLGFDPVSVDELVRKTGLTASEISSMLLILELRGWVEAHAGGAYSRKHNKKP